MESKAHYKKCLEKGIDPQTPIEDGANAEEDRLATTASSHNPPQNTEDCDTVSDDYSDGDELEIDIESSGKNELIGILLNILILLYHGTLTNRRILTFFS